ncbi:TetR/AcrR family transcriptional regulator [Erwinia endophytica]|uniref:TetR/AcrR family transcriptional regulator n=1 Tax=Erwinia endophytica TaxID=1563158 RepID=UPI003083EE13
MRPARIRSEAGVSTRTLYRYFPSRGMLTEAVLAERQHRFFAALLPPEDPQSISRLFVVQSEWMQENGPSGCFFLKAWGEYAKEDQRLSALALDYRYRQREYIAACLRNSPGAALSDAVWMLFEGAILLLWSLLPRRRFMQARRRQDSWQPAVKSHESFSVTGYHRFFTYGMARSSWGLMLPAVVKDIPFGSVALTERSQ